MLHLNSNATHSNPFQSGLRLGLFLVGCLGGALHEATVFARDAASRPNMVFILIDDLRADTFGYANHPFVETPHIDALAAGGLRFRNAFVTSSLCSPARASFLTGQYMHTHRVVDNADLMPAGTPTFPPQLQHAGYETAFIGKWHMGGSTAAPRPGFDHWVSFRGQGTYAPDGQTINVNGKEVPRQKYMTDELTDYSVEWLQSRTEEKPFLLYLAHKGVHGLYDPAPRHRDRYRLARYEIPQRQRHEEPMWVRDQRNSWHGVEFPYHGRSGQTVPEMYRHYCEMILSIDDSVGRIMEALRDARLDQNTLVIFTSDGGHLWGEHGLIDKRCAYEESIRIPLIANWPNRIAPGNSCDAIVANIDVAPTLLELAGLPIPESIDGRSLTSLLQQPSDVSDWRKALLYEYYWEPSFPQTPTTFALRSFPFKLIQYHGIWDTDELYNLEKDPHETRNLIRDPAHQQLVRQMRAELHRRLAESNGLVIPLGFKRNHGSNLRLPEGTRRAEFPDYMLKRP